jgi:hypothetical protein
MKHLKIKINYLTFLTTIFLIAFTGACKKDTYVQKDGVCPTVIATNPLDQAVNVPANQVVTATFNEKMDSKTIDNTSFVLLNGSTVVPGSLSYNESDATISFVPTTTLSGSSSLTGKIKAGIKDLNGNALQSDYVWSFSTGAILLPVVISTDPLSNETNVVNNKTITATFNMVMDPLTMTAANFAVDQGTTSVTGTVSYNGTTISFAPSATLTPNTVYTCTITNAAKNAAGNAMANNYTWSFTTGITIAPQVISTDPVNNATAVVVNKIITATFSEPMNAATISGTTFLLSQGTLLIAGNVTYNGNTASLDPNVDLAQNTVYTCTITTGAKNPAGTSISNNFIWSFTTGALTAPKIISTDPSNNATGVPLNKTIKAVFDQNMDGLTINASNFLLKEGSNSVTGVVTLVGTSALFSSSANLLPGKLYTATITMGAKNPAGVSIANDYIWSFTTLAATPLPPFVDLKTAGRFGIIAGVGVSNNAGFSQIHDMDVGIYPGVRSSITGFPPAIVINGAIYASDDIAPPGVPAMLAQAKLDLTAAYLFAEGATAPAPATVAGDLGGQTLAPGIYKSTSTLLIQNGDLTLDAGGNPDAFWVFQIASAFTTVGGAGGNVILSGGAQAKNVFWQTGSSATIGDYTSFKGTVLALTSITMNSGATAIGRMLARNGAVVLTNTNIINKP